MTNQPDIIEFYLDDEIHPMRVTSSMVPPVDSYVSIAKKTYRVSSVTFALDYSDKVFQRQMRANVDLIKAK